MEKVWLGKRRQFIRDWIKEECGHGTRYSKLGFVRELFLTLTFA